MITLTMAIPDLEISAIRFSSRVLWMNDTSYSKMFDEVNRKLPAINTTVQLLTVYTDSESHNAQRHRQTDRRHYDAKNLSYCLTVGTIG